MGTAKIIRKAVIPAAGMGTRFLPATKALPKEMLPIIDKPIIQYVIEEVLESGIEDLIIITGRGKRAIEDHFDESFELENFLRVKNNLEALNKVEKISNLVNLHYIRQKEAKGLGHAILQARQHIGHEPFAVLLGDEIFKGHTKPATKQLIDIYEQTKSSVLAIREVAKEQVKNYGVISPLKYKDGVIKVGGLVEKPSPEKAPSNLAIIGRYVLEPEIFDILAKIPPGYNDEIQLTDALQEMIKTKNIYAVEIKGERYDVGDKLGYLQAIVEFALVRDDLKGNFKKFLKELQQ